MAGVAVAQARGDQPLPGAHERLAQAAADGVPVLVPTSMPAGYAFWTGPVTQVQTGRAGGDRVLSAETLYRPTSGSGRPFPVVAVCWERADVDLCGDQSAPLVTEVVGEFRVEVRSVGSGAPVPAWAGVTFTEDWQGVGWVRTSRPETD